MALTDSLSVVTAKRVGKCKPTDEIMCTPESMQIEHLNHRRDHCEAQEEEKGDSPVLCVII